MNATLAVTPIAWTHFDAAAAAKVMGGFTTDADGGQALAEAAGRSCYQSWAKPNPATATNAGYLANILAQQHESVVEHASVSFYVTGVSRSLLAELSRHRHISLSVVSQRYVDESAAAMVVPPVLVGDKVAEALLVEVEVAAEIAYVGLVAHLTEAGVPRKRAREAARAVLPNMTETRFVVTGNLRAWRDVLRKRWHVAADAEIRAFAGQILDHLRRLAPNAVQDMPTDPFGGV